MDTEFVKNNYCWYLVKGIMDEIQISPVEASKLFELAYNNYPNETLILQNLYEYLSEIGKSLNANPTERLMSKIHEIEDSLK